ncbi:hypothetical protein SAMN04487972_10220 [Paracoccus halophilus]|uniref:Uncharacterized protein n=1 Tax=Paracoccus halophilus TaxID=376733 RepID=A0A1I0SMQ2_9RHOB|nr:hypothetical protein [Paracoccus halophilus]SFA40707.1 hypothetical protein SAMN04487972_10220 [Paracoccus halophilus]
MRFACKTAMFAALALFTLPGLAVADDDDWLRRSLSIERALFRDLTGWDDRPVRRVWRDDRHRHDRRWSGNRRGWGGDDDDDDRGRRGRGRGRGGHDDDD